jgi:hypothetical protein
MLPYWVVELGFGPKPQGTRRMLAIHLRAIASDFVPTLMGDLAKIADVGDPAAERCRGRRRPVGVNLLEVGAEGGA